MHKVTSFLPKIISRIFGKYFVNAYFFYHVEIGVQTNRIRTDKADITFIFLFLFGFEYEYR